MSITVIGTGKTDSVSPASSQGITYNKKILSETNILDGATSVTISNIPQDYDEISVEFSDIYSTSGSNGEIHAILNADTTLGSYGYTIFELDSSPGANSIDISSAVASSFGSNASAANAIANTVNEASTGVNKNTSFAITIPNYTSQIASKTVLCYAKCGSSQIKFTDGIYVPKTAIKSIKIESTVGMSSGTYTRKQRVRVYGVTYGS